MKKWIRKEMHVKWRDMKFDLPIFPRSYNIMIDGTVAMICKYSIFQVNRPNMDNPHANPTGNPHAFLFEIPTAIPRDSYGLQIHPSDSAQNIEPHSIQRHIRNQKSYRFHIVFTLSMCEYGHSWQKVLLYCKLTFVRDAISHCDSGVIALLDSLHMTIKLMLLAFKNASQLLGWVDGGNRRCV